MLIGTIMAFMGPSTKLADCETQGWLHCNGRSFTQTGDYAALYNVIGTIYGSESSGKFNIPDLRGYFLRGVDDEKGVDRDYHTRTKVNSSEIYYGAGSLQPCATKLPATAFSISMSEKHHHGDPTWNGEYGCPYEIAINDRGPGCVDYGAQSAPTTDDGAHTHTIGGGDNETRPVNISVYWLIYAKVVS